MSLAFGSRFSFRMVGSPQIAGFDTPMQKTEMFGAVGATYLRGERTTSQHVYEVAQDGFVSRQTAKAASVAVQGQCGQVDTLTITNEATINACLVNAKEVKIQEGRGTTTGHHVRMQLTFEEIAQ